MTLSHSKCFFCFSQSTLQGLYTWLHIANGCSWTTTCWQPLKHIYNFSLFTNAQILQNLKIWNILSLITLGFVIEITKPEHFHTSCLQITSPPHKLHIKEIVTKKIHIISFPHKSHRTKTHDTRKCNPSWV